jgi:hypothetical protein
MWPYVLGSFIVMVIETGFFQLFGEWMYRHSKLTFIPLIVACFILLFFGLDSKFITLGFFSCAMYLAILLAMQAIGKLAELD